jgi:glycosyltransferase involved in cell wall biosynthesis
MKERVMNQTKMVTVLLSTYNGAPYIGEQLDSIINQSYKNIKIIVRDDGSKDGTQDVLREYEEKGLIQAIYGDNMGVTKSFFWLLANAGEADYYSFAEQDDVWLPQKLERAIERLEKEDNNIPQIFASAYDFYDSQMKFIGPGPRITHPNSLVRTLVVTHIYLGFTMVINPATKKLIDDSDTVNMELSCYHDYWLTLIGLSLGNIIYDPEVTIKYRRHENNVSTFKTDFWEIQKDRIQKFIFGNELKSYQDSSIDFYKLYRGLMKEEVRKKFRLFMKHRRYSMKIALKKCFYPERYRDSWFDEIGLRIFFLTGKM